MARERFAGRRRAFGHDVELSSVVDGPFAVEDPGIRAAVDRFVIYYRELANLEWFGQQGGDRPWAHR